MLNIVLFGAPGCGKGTQSELLEKKFGLSHISTGEIIRSQIKAQTPLGVQMQEYISRGELAPDSIVIGMVENYLAEHQDIKGTIFDGFPRNTYQAEQFDVMLAECGQKVDVMLSLRVPDEELIKRLLLRGEVSGRADDANEEVIGNRIRIYKEQTEIVENYYSEQGKFVAIDGVGTVEEIFERLCAAVERL